MCVYHALHIYMHVHMHAIAFFIFLFSLQKKQFLNNQNAFTLK